MPAVINQNKIELQPDNLGYQAARVNLPTQPSNADTMVFYYRVYVDGWPNGQYMTENISNYGWNKDFYFGLSFSDSVAANNGGIVGWANVGNGNELGNSWIQGTQPVRFASFFGNNTIPLSASGQYFTPSGSDGDYFYYGSRTKTNRISVNTPYGGGAFCPTTQAIGLSGANQFLGIIKIKKNVNDATQIVLSVGTNWENLSINNFSHSLSSTKTNWNIFNTSQSEITNFRPYSTNPSLSGTIVFPSWIVSKWPSAVTNRKLIISEIKVEYYDNETLLRIV